MGGGALTDGSGGETGSRIGVNLYHHRRECALLIANANATKVSACIRQCAVVDDGVSLGRSESVRTGPLVVGIQ